MSKFLELICEIVGNDIDVTLSNRDGRMIADLNFQAKSHGYLVENGEDIYLEMRYGESHVIDEVSDILHQFLRAYRMRYFGSESWLNWCEREGMIEKEVTTTTTIKWK